MHVLAPLALSDRWTELGGGDRQELLLVREGPVLLGTREYLLRLPTGAVLVGDANVALRLRRGEPGVSPVLLRAACTAEGGLEPPLRCALLPQLHDPDSELARALSRLPDGGTRDVFEAAWQAQRDSEALIDRCSGRSFERRREQYLRLARARAVLAWGEGAPLDVVRVAEIARLSPHYFVALFHRVFGISPHQYRIERRMQEARRLVAQTCRPIREILNQLGLDSHSTFTRVFRRQFGMSATSLRAATSVRATRD
jgi:AraC-like DNA-binding protein